MIESKKVKILKGTSEAGANKLIKRFPFILWLMQFERTSTVSMTEMENVLFSFFSHQREVESEFMCMWIIVYLFICLFICLSICLFIYLFIDLLIYLFLSIIFRSYNCYVDRGLRSLSHFTSAVNKGKPLHSIIVCLRD